MKVRLKSDITGLRNGQPWPPAGSEVDVPEDEAAGLIASGLADKPRSDHETVQVPPAGVHTPGATGVTEAPAQDLTVETPADAVADPDQVPDSAKVEATPDQAAQLASDPAPEPTPARQRRPASSSPSKTARRK